MIGLIGNIWQPSVIFGRLPKFSENDGKCSYGLWTVYGEFSKNFGNRWKMLVEFVLFVFVLFYMFAALTREL